MSTKHPSVDVMKVPTAPTNAITTQTIPGVVHVGVTTATQTQKYVVPVNDINTASDDAPCFMKNLNKKQ